MKKILYYEALTDAELMDMDKESAMVILPISLLEAHGPHLPLGTDFLMAGKLAEALAQRIQQDDKIVKQVIILPTVPLGAGGILRMGTLNHAQTLVEQTIAEFGERLADHGFEKGVIISGHAGQGHLSAMAEAADVLRETGIFNFLPLTSALFKPQGMEKMKDALKRQFKENGQEALPLYDGHAGCWETSLALLFFPELVHETYKDLPHSESAEENGYRGDPSFANVELGRKLRDFLLNIAMEVMTEHFGKAWERKAR